MANHVLIVGAGLSAYFKDQLYTDVSFMKNALYKYKKDLLHHKDEEDENKPENLKRAFLRWALYRLYNKDSTDRSFLNQNGSPETVGLETTWSEIYANRNNPKFIFEKKEVEKIRDFWEKLAQLEDKQKLQYKYYQYHAYDNPESRSVYETFFLFAGWELRKLVLEIYGQLRFKDIGEDQQEDYKKFINKVFYDKEAQKQIISFNYDIILDEAIESVIGKKKYVGIDKFKPGTIEFLKPHGSVNWYETRYEKSKKGKVSEWINGIVPLDKVGFKNNKLFWPSIIPPIDKKNFNEHSIIKRIYAKNLAGKIRSRLLRADIITIVGYSFPIGDQHVRSILSDVKKIRTQKRNKIKEVKYIDLALTNDRYDIRKLTVKNLFYAEKFRGYSGLWIDWVNNKGEEKEF